MKCVRFYRCLIEASSVIAGARVCSRINWVSRVLSVMLTEQSETIAKFPNTVVLSSLSHLGNDRWYMDLPSLRARSHLNALLQCMKLPLRRLSLHISYRKSVSRIQVLLIIPMLAEALCVAAPIDTSARFASIVLL